MIPHVRAFDPGPYSGRVLGIIVASGSSFSHLGSVARELSIPALFGACGAWERLDDGDEVEIDGESGIVTVLSRAKAADGKAGRVLRNSAALGIPRI